MEVAGQEGTSAYRRSYGIDVTVVPSVTEWEYLRSRYLAALAGIDRSYQIHVHSGALIHDMKLSLFFLECAMDGLDSLHQECISSKNPHHIRQWNVKRKDLLRGIHQLAEIVGRAAVQVSPPEVNNQ